MSESRRYTIYWGTSDEEELTVESLRRLQSSLTSSTTDTGVKGELPFGAGGYKYIAQPSWMSPPHALTDASTGFTMDYVQTGAVDDVDSYRVYRSTYKLGGPITIAVS